MDPIERRLAQLERANEWLRRGLVLAVLVPMTLLLTALTWYPKQLEAESLVVRASNGQIIAFIGGDGTAGPTFGDGVLTLYRRDGSLSLLAWPENNRVVRLSVIGPENADGSVPVMWSGPPR